MLVKVFHCPEFPPDPEPGFDLRPLATTNGNHAAFVGELGVSASYQFTNVWSVWAGYGVLWLSGVALAPDQLDYNLGGGTVLDSRGNVLYHGGHLGLEARW